MLTTQLIRLLGQAAGGKIAPEMVLALLGFAALNYLPVILSLTLFIAVLLTLSRSYRDSEMVVWFASGQPLTAWIRPVVKFALPLVLAIAVLSLVLSPWALARGNELRSRWDRRDDTAQITPGTFRESGAADRVFFVEAGEGDHASVRNIFISSVQHGQLGVMFSSEGYLETHANGDRFVVLLNGRRYEGRPGSADYRIMEFERYAVRVETRESRQIETSPRNMSIAELAADWNNAAKGEMVWRIGIPLSALNLALLAIPLSFVNPRGGRTNNLVLAILSFMIYNNLVSVSQAWVTQGRLEFSSGWWPVHLVMAALLCLLFFRRIAPLLTLRRVA